MSDEKMVKKISKELDELYKKMLQEKQASSYAIELLKEKALKVYYLSKALQ